MDALSSIFGIKPQDSIFLPDHPYAVRFNCQVGQLATSETDFLGASTEISIVKVARKFGTIGRTAHTEWLQLFYVGAPSSKELPENTVCVSYVKTRSLTQFQHTITRLLGEGVNPATGIFKVAFDRHSNGDRNYYSVRFDWRERKGKAEETQLAAIANFMQSGPRLADLNGGRLLLEVDGLDPEILERLMIAGVEQARLERGGADPLHPAELLHQLATSSLATA